MQQEGIKSIYLPFNIGRLLEHMSLKQRRETVHGRIEDQYLKYDQTVNMIKNFVKLFIIDKGAVDTISQDEWSKKIKTAIYKRELNERRSNGEKINV